MLKIPLSAVRHLPPQKVNSIMAVAASAAKPILVHCQSGANRSDLFCAAWKLRIEHAPIDNASKQFSFVYAHVPFFRNRIGAMHSSVHDYICFIGDGKMRKQ